MTYLMARLPCNSYKYVTECCQCHCHSNCSLPVPCSVSHNPVKEEERRHAEPPSKRSKPAPSSTFSSADILLEECSEEVKPPPSFAGADPCRVGNGHGEHSCVVKQPTHRGSPSNGNVSKGADRSGRILKESSTANTPDIKVCVCACVRVCVRAFLCHQQIFHQWT